MTSGQRVPVRDVQERLSSYPGVPDWWAEVLVNVGLSSEEAEAYVITASQDAGSPLRLQHEADLNASLRVYAEARGITLLGVGAGDGVSPPIAKRSTISVSTIANAVEQAKAEAEVSEFADVLFKDRLTGVYSEHAVANAVRSVHQTYGRRMASPGSRILELGASVKALVAGGVDPETNHACCPVLDLRDGVRYSIGGYLEHVLSDRSSYSVKCKRTAAAALDPESGFLCRCRAQECSWKADFIFSNESTHDVPFGDLPNIMARHGARTWVGFMARAKGLRRGGGNQSGSCDVMGTRWRTNSAKGTITFHFARDASFSYTHDLSQWLRYEENVEFRWYGRYFDYVYCRLPITTDASLAFMIARVPKAGALLPNPVYASGGQDGMVKVHSIRAKGGCVGAASVKFEPCEFVMERLAFDKVLEHRLVLGVRGNLASTIAYMRSVRVRLFVNGVALGATMVVPSDVLESAAVAVEAIAFDAREGMDRDYGGLMAAATVDKGLGARLWNYFSTCASVVPSLRSALRKALVALTDVSSELRIYAEPCAKFVRVDCTASAELADVEVLSASGCGCADYADVVAALQVGDCLGAKERLELERYRLELEAAREACEFHGRFEEPSEDQFFDACSVLPAEDAKSEDDVFSDSGIDGCSAQESDDVRPAGAVVSAVREYARWVAYKERCDRSEAATFASVLFLNGNPSEEDVARATTGRNRHGVVAVIGGVLGKMVGTMQEDEIPAEVYDPESRRFHKVLGHSGGQRYVSESITRLCYTSTALCVLNGEQLARAAYRVLESVPPDIELPTYLFVNAVPGAGKTTSAVKSMKESAALGKKVMYLTTTSASAAEVLSKLTGVPGVDSAYVRTLDSFMCGQYSAPVGGIDELYVDEAPMSHAGEVLAAVLRVGPREVTMYGDRHQIPVMSFCAGFKFERESLLPFVRVVNWSETHRFGKYVCAMWLDVYGSIYPCKCCVHDEGPPEVRRILSAADVPALPGGKVLCFTQEERSNLKRELGFKGSVKELKRRDEGGLSTVAEDQGGTHDEVSVVRMVNRKNPKESVYSPSIYNAQPWVLVGSTRQRGKLVYYTAADPDLLTTRIGLARCPVRLRAVESRLSWGEVCGEAVAPPKFGAWCA